MTELFEKKPLSKKEKMEELKKQLAELELPDDLEMPKALKPNMQPELQFEMSNSSNSSDEEVQIKPKRERTEKQKLAFEKAQQTKMLNAEKRRKERMQKEAEEKKELEKKLIEKAIKVKKKQIKKMKVIDELSDDDTPIERKPKLPPPPIQIPKIRFV
jgi:hypothetical protein